MKQKRQPRASKNRWSSSAAAKSGFTSASAVQVALELDQPRPAERIDGSGYVRADGEQRIGGGQRVGRGQVREFVGAHPCQRDAGAPPLSHPFALEISRGGHELHYHPAGESRREEGRRHGRGARWGGANLIGGRLPMKKGEDSQSEGCDYQIVRSYYGG